MKLKTRLSTFCKRKFPVLNISLQGNIKLIPVFIIAILMGISAMAQKQKENRQRIIDHKTELGLTDLQVDQIKTLQKEYFPKIQEARKAEDRETLKKLNEERKAKIEQILTPEQVIKWREIVEKKEEGFNNPELKKAIADYKKKTIRPVLLEKRKTFDNELSAEEKEIIASLRARRRAFVKSEEIPDKDIRMMKGKELKMEALKTLKPIIEKHKISLEKIKSELEPFRIQWESDLDSIRAKNFANKKAGGQKDEKTKSEMRMLIHFLLMNPEA